MAEKHYPVWEPVFSEGDALAVADVVRGGYLNERRLTKQFEDDFASYVGSKYAVATVNGTMALFMALKASGINHLSLVAIPIVSAIGTLRAVELTGASIVFIDVEPDTGNLSLDSLLDVPKQVDLGIDAIVPVHLNGRSYDIPRMSELCAEKGWKMIEDACQAIGSRHGSKNLGAYGDCGVFSLATSKIVTCGQGGVVVTDNEETYTKLQAMKDQGRVRDVDASTQSSSYPYEGYNLKFDEVKAALILSQMKNLSHRIKGTEAVEWVYRELLGDAISLPERKEHLWRVELKHSDPRLLQKKLREKGIDTQLYSDPLYLGSEAKYPKMEKYRYSGLYLPSSFTLAGEDVEYICDKVKTCV